MAQFLRMLTAGACAAALALGTAEAARAQVLNTPQEISYCLCLDRGLATRLAELTVRRNAYEALARTIRDREAALDRRRSTIDVNNQAEVDAFKQQLEELDALKARENQVTLPDYQTAASSYNERVLLYTDRCASHTFDSGVTEQVRATLTCPIE